LPRRCKLWPNAQGALTTAELLMMVKRGAVLEAAFTRGGLGAIKTDKKSERDNNRCTNGNRRRWSLLIAAELAGVTVSSQDLPDTFPKLLVRNARVSAGRLAMREKKYGIWQNWTWSQARDEVGRIAAGLVAMDVRRGDRVAIVGDNRPTLYWSICAAQVLGAVPVPLHEDAVAEEMGVVIDHADADIAIAENQEQVDKLLLIRAAHGRPARIVYLDPRGLRDYSEPGLLSLEELLERGDVLVAARPGFVSTEIANGAGTDLAVLLYTSGTTGPPKGVRLSHENVIRSAANAVRFDGLTAAEEVLAYLPMAWIGDHVTAYGESFVAGFCLSCPESGETVLTDLREIGPTFFVAPPRIFENLLSAVALRMDGAGRMKRAMYDYFIGVARRVGGAILDGRRVPLGERLLYRLGDLLIYAPLLNALGFGRVRLAYVVGEAIGPDIFAFYRALGLNLKQFYGMTEAGGCISLQPDGQVRADSVGLPAPEVKIRIAADGEVLVKSPGVFLGYHKNARATAAAWTPDGWLRTGDTGFLAPDGQLHIVDRAADLGRLTNGTVFAPKYIENKLKFFPYVKEAVAFGDGRDAVVCLINIDVAAVSAWAERRGLSYGSYQELAGMPEVRDLVQDCVVAVNRDFDSDPALAGSRIKRFLVLHKELDADDGELTRMRKIRRHVVAERYAALIEALYSGEENADIRTVVA
jgi:long-chain acyl-CoA synthetase